VLTATPTGAVSMNLNRWYSDQFGVAEVPGEAALPLVELAGKPGRLVEVKGTFQGRDGAKPGYAALVAYLANGEQVVMTLKLTGPEAVVAGNKDKFVALAKSLRSASVSPDPSAPPIEPGQPMPDNHPPIGDTPKTPSAAHAQPAAPAASPFTATIPAGWTAKPGTSRAVHHTFGTDGEVYVSQLGGTLKPTLDIWRGEFQLDPLTDAELAALPKLAFLGDDAVLLDMQGDFAAMMTGKKITNARQLVAARVDDGTFAKMLGSAADVAAQADAFRTFCASVRRAR
jgi:hypothetical protein